jgi:hypothetical protein
VWVERELKNARDCVKFDESFAVVEIQEWRGGYYSRYCSLSIFYAAIIGVITVGALGLAVDPTTNRLMESYIFAQPGYIALSHHT